MFIRPDPTGNAPSPTTNALTGFTTRALVIWCAFVPIAIANGAVRDLIIGPAVGEAMAHVISTMLLCLAILGWTWLTIGWMRPADARAAVQIGLFWLALTVAFEFLAGRFVFGTSWQRLLADYNLAEGRVWLLVPVTTAFAPWLAARSSRKVMPTSSESRRSAFRPE